MSERQNDFEDRNHLSETNACIRDLNDDFRRNLSGGQVLITPGFQSLENETRSKALMAIQETHLEHMSSVVWKSMVNPFGSKLMPMISI